MEIIFDDRSANSLRTTGWERYSRSLLAALGRTVRPMELPGDGLFARFRGDLITLPRTSRQSVIIHYPTYPPLVTSQPFVWTVHDLTWWRFPKYASRLGRSLYRPLGARAVQRGVLLADSVSVRLELIEYLGLDERMVISAPLGLPQLPPPSGRRRSRPYLLVVGSVEPRKNLEAFVRAFQASGVAGTHDLVICGRIGWGSLPEGVTPESGLSDAALSDLYAGASAFIFPSHYEGFGLPILEALRAATPVFCSDIPVFREVGGPHCSYFDQYSLESMVEAVRQASVATPIESPTAWLQRFSWERCAEDTRAAYRLAEVLCT
jgi:glycosyltransferase involved in cell wall biosynthesis